MRDCCEGAARPEPGGVERRARLASGAVGARAVGERVGCGLSLGCGAALAAAAPKCPVCLAAYLSVFGVGAGAAASIHPWMRPVGAAVCLGAVALLFARWRRSERRRSA